MYVLVTHRNVAVYPGGTYRRELNFFVRLAMLLQITQGEHDLMLDLLHSALGNLREEIYKTEAAGDQAQLKQREKVLTGLLAPLTGADALN
jgi:hypothetical protein